MSNEGARNLETVMKAAFPEAMIKVPIGLEELMTNHPKDRHVLAAAVVATEIIVTRNIKDFQDEDLNYWNVRTQSPDDFLCDLFEQYPKIMVQILLKQSQNYKRNPRTVVELLDKLSNQIPKFSEKIRTFIT